MVQKKHSKTFFSFLLPALAAVFFAPPLFAQSRYPVISDLSSRNPVFAQYMQEVESSYKDLARGESHISLGLYSYTAQKGDTLMKIAARCTLPYETLAGINRIPSPDADLTGKRLLLPTVAGLFVSLSPATSFEYLLLKRDFDFTAFPCYTFNTVSFYFIAGGKLSSTERAFFLDTGLRLPLPDGVLTSPYGMRVSPITGNEHFHEGIDLAAPRGTPVLACRAGTVLKSGFDRIYGNYLVLAHDNGSESLYAHMETVFAEKGQAVTGGGLIGRVGSTGASTGPHLHFEIRVNGKSKNPNTLF